MREAFAERSLNYVSKYNNYNELELVKIKYGLEALYTIITKTLGILLISLFLKIFKETVLLMALYGTMRLFGHGIHAKKSSHCWIASIITYVAFPLLIKYFVIKKTAIICCWALSFISFAIWAPADTPKKPIVNKKKRILDKIITIIVSIFLLAIAIKSNNILVNNCIFFSYIMSMITINPLTYKLFGIPFNNYKTFN
ncbi:MAG: hypothetical protein E7158_02110 [Firmicutes bacterium]|nr:hypothetical protein [Bacillota bacterium]